MERFKGWLYEPGSARRREACIQVESDGSVDVDGRLTGHWSSLRVSERIGSIPRRLTMPDGRVFETSDNDGIDRLEARFTAAKSSALLHRLEKHWRWAMAATLVAAIVGWLTVDQGVPLISKAVAYALPESVLELTARQTLSTMDRLALSPSKLDAPTKARLEVLLARTGKAAGGGYRYELALRDGGEIGANAFALPDGTIVMTDQLVKLAESDSQIAGVLAHEIGHVQNRHGMQRIVQGSALGAIALFVLGDVSQAISTLPAMLLQSAYTRDFEREADAFAVDLMGKMNIPAENLATFLERLEESQKNGPVPGWLSTHPPTPERKRMIEEMQKGQPI